MQAIRPYGRGKIAIHLPASHPALKALKAGALFAVTYSKAGEIVAYDLAYPASEADRLRRIVAEIEPI